MAHSHHRVAFSSDLHTTATDLLTALDRSAVALNTIAHTLENEFSQRFGHTGANPLEIAKRLRRLQRDLPQLQQECQAVLQCKQELVDSARRVLDANTSQLQALCSKSGFAAASDSERDGQQEVHEAYRSALREWEGQVLQRYASGHDDEQQRLYNSQTLNQALARARMQ